MRSHFFLRAKTRGNDSRVPLQRGLSRGRLARCTYDRRAVFWAL